MTESMFQRIRLAFMIACYMAWFVTISSALIVAFGLITTAIPLWIVAFSLPLAILLTFVNIGLWSWY